MTYTRFRFARPLWSCFIVVVWAFGAWSEERTATEWVQAMHEAQSMLSFEGSFKFWNGTDITTIEYHQHVVDGKVHVKAKPHQGPKREISRTDEEVSINFSPDDELRDVSNELSGNSLSRFFPPDVATLSESYDISELPDRKIADRDAVGISIMPKHADRHGFKVWIDRGTALLLRMEMCDCDDAARRLSMLEFTEISILEDSVPVLSVTAESQESDLSVSIVDEDQSDSANVQADWETSYIPDGFKLSSTKSKDGVLFNRTYSDGMNMFTVQIRPIPGFENVDIQLETILGPTIIASRNSMDSLGQPQIITVVGDLPRRTIWKISEGVKFER